MLTDAERRIFTLIEPDVDGNGAVRLDPMAIWEAVYEALGPSKLDDIYRDCASEDAKGDPVPPAVFIPARRRLAAIARAAFGLPPFANGAGPTDGEAVGHWNRFAAWETGEKKDADGSPGGSPATGSPPDAP